MFHAMLENSVDNTSWQKQYGEGEKKKAIMLHETGIFSFIWNFWNEIGLHVVLDKIFLFSMKTILK